MRAREREEKRMQTYTHSAAHNKSISKFDSIKSRTVEMKWKMNPNTDEEDRQQKKKLK